MDIILTEMTTRVGARVLCRRGRSRPLLARLVGRAVYIFSVVVGCLCVLAVFCRLLTPVPRSAECAGDDNVARTCDESKKSINVFDETKNIGVVASDAAISSEVQSGSRFVRKLIRSISRRGGPKWANTFRLDVSAVGQPIGEVTEQISWEVCRPIKQRKKATCALVACAVAVEAMHRLVYEAHHGASTFPWRAAEPHKLLLRACQSEGIWEKGKGAYVRDVLKMIRELGRKQLANDPPSDARIVLPLSSWDVHRWDDGYGLSPERVAKLLDCGPCVGTLWVCPWYYLFDASRDGGAWVYRGCGRSQADRDESKRLYGHKVVSHAVVCFGYRRCRDQMHVLVLDNHTATGPRRWVHVEEIDALYTLDVERMDPPTLASASGD